MKTFLLNFDELAVLLNFFHAKEIPGVELDLKPVSAELIKECQKSLAQKNLVAKGPDSGTLHFNDDLIESITTLAVPLQLILVKEHSQKKSLQFCLTKSTIASIEVSDDMALITQLSSFDELIEKLFIFLGDSNDGVVAIATSTGSTLAPMAHCVFQNGKMTHEQTSVGFRPLHPKKFHRHIRLLPTNVQLATV